MARSCHPCSNSVAAPFPLSIPSHHFFKKIAFFQKKSPEYFVSSKKGRTFALAFGKNLRASIEIDH